MKKVLFSNYFKEDPEYVKDGKGDFIEISVCTYDYVKDGEKLMIPYVALVEDKHLTTFNQFSKVYFYVKEFFDEEEMNTLMTNYYNVKKQYINDKVFADVFNIVKS